MEVSSKKGVFSPSSSLDSEYMINCLQALYNDHPSIKFLSINLDEELSGFRVAFSEPDVSTVLNNGHLLSTYDSIDIFPLTTYLLIKGINQNKTLLFERDMRDAISKTFGKVLSIMKYDSEPSLKDWRVEIDVPEFKDLPVFQSDSFSKMTVLLPNRNEEFKVEFWCRHCKESGHFQYECSRKSEPEVSTPNKTDNSTKKTNIRKESDSSSIEKKSQMPSEKSNIALEPTEKYAEKIGREEVYKTGLISNGKQNSKENNKNQSETEESEAKKLLTEKEIKKEVEMRPDTSEKNNSDKKHSEISENKVLEKELRSKYKEKDEKINQSSAAASDDDDDDDVQVVQCKAEDTNFDEVSRSSSDARSGDSTTPSSSATIGLPYTLPSVTRPVRGAEVTSVLSERLQETINAACDEVKVLDRKTLDAFLIHVKKKSNPIRVALNYTPNAKGLKEQLKKILHIYYNTPQTGTKEDIAFIKWLNGLVDRFDGSIPRKRKRADKNTDDPPDPHDPPYKK